MTRLRHGEGQLWEVIDGWFDGFSTVIRSRYPHLTARGLGTRGAEHAAHAIENRYNLTLNTSRMEEFTPAPEQYEQEGNRQGYESFNLDKFDDREIIRMARMFGRDFEDNYYAEEVEHPDSLQRGLINDLRVMIEKSPERAKKLLVMLKTDEIGYYGRATAAYWAPYFAGLDYELACQTIIDSKLDPEEDVYDSAVDASNLFYTLITPEQRRDFKDRERRAVNAHVYDAPPPDEYRSGPNPGETG